MALVISHSEIILRLALATLFGFVIGWEREILAKAAGVRDHILVCVGSALITLVSMYGFPNADPSRVAAQIITGIGFLGAGVIMRHADTVKGVTTAASIWATSGIGLAVATGFYFGSVIGVVIIFLTLEFNRLYDVRKIEYEKGRFRKKIEFKHIDELLKHHHNADKQQEQNNKRIK